MGARRPFAVHRLALALSLLLIACTTQPAGDPTPAPGFEPTQPAPLLDIGSTPQLDEAQPTPRQGPDHNIVLPDIAVSPPRELYVQATATGRELRFSTTVSNVGEGPLEILGSFEDETGRAIATQLIHRREGSPLAHPLGTLDFDGGHGHWHTQDFVIFELWSYAEDGALEELLASTGKIGFCLLDFTRVDPAPPYVADLPLFDECHWTRQGLSPGWQETYAAYLPGQELDISDIPDGRYVIKTILDPENRIIDASRLNTTVAVFVELSGTSIRVLEPASER